jgi:hypothetical protein
MAHIPRQALSAMIREISSAPHRRFTNSPLNSVRESTTATRLGEDGASCGQKIAEPLIKLLPPHRRYDASGAIGNSSRLQRNTNGWVTWQIVTAKPANETATAVGTTGTIPDVDGFPVRGCGRKTPRNRFHHALPRLIADGHGLTYATGVEGALRFTDVVHMSFRPQ